MSLSCLDLKGRAMMDRRPPLTFEPRKHPPRPKILLFSNDVAKNLFCQRSVVWSRMTRSAGSAERQINIEEISH